MKGTDDIRYAVVNNLFPSFTKGAKRCIRLGNEGDTIAHIRRGRSHAPRVDIHYVSRVAPSERWEDAHVWLVSLSEAFHKRWYKQKKNFYVVAMHAGAVEAYLKNRFGSLPQRYAGAARHAIGTAMRKVSTRNGNTEQTITKHARNVATANVTVRTSWGADYAIHIADTLSYAMAAVRGGQTAVELAYKKAANKIAGRITQALKRSGGLESAVPAPFPEIVRRRKAS